MTSSFLEASYCQSQKKECGLIPESLEHSGCPTSAHSLTFSSFLHVDPHILLPWLRPQAFICLLLSSFSPSELKPLLVVMVVVILIQISADRNLQAYCSIWCCAKSLPPACGSGLVCPPMEDATCLLHSPSSLIPTQTWKLLAWQLTLKGS